VRLEGLGRLKENAIILSGFEPATFQNLAERPDQLRYLTTGIVRHYAAAVQYK
jgi:hypothetical protein